MPPKMIPRMPNPKVVPYEIIIQAVILKSQMTHIFQFAKQVFLNIPNIWK